MTSAVQAKTVYKIKGIEIVLEVGQVAASDVELAEYLGCNRKTIGKLIDSFNRLGMLTTPEPITVLPYIPCIFSQAGMPGVSS